MKTNYDDFKNLNASIINDVRDFLKEHEYKLVAASTLQNYNYCRACLHMNIVLFVITGYFELF